MDVLVPFLGIALSCIRRGWFVFPCKPETKKPATPNGYLDASNDEAQVRAWWGRTPRANVAIATSASGLTVWDCDHGLTDEQDLREFIHKHSIIETYGVRTGRRDGFGVQLYYETRGEPLKSIPWELDGCSGDIRSETGYVMAAGSIHPDSGQPYEVLWDLGLKPVPDTVRALKSRAKEKAHDDGGPIYEHRNVTLTSIAGKLRNAGLSVDAIEAALLQVNADRCIPPLDEEEVKRIAGNAGSWPIPEPDAIPVLGTGTPKEPEPPRDWRELFHSKKETDEAPPVTFLIEGFLQREGITAVCGPVRERKSLVALNVAFSLVTGEPLFDYFKVAKKPDRVLYLCPEVSLGPFCDRLKRIGLDKFVGRNFFYRTLSADGQLTLDAPELKPGLPGSVVVLDTAIRFYSGDENSSQDARAFADSIFALLRDGAEAVILLHHSPKGGGSDGMSLENMMRGSGDLGAFVCSCWGTKLQDPTRPYESPSFLSNLKQRDFESKDFNVVCTPDCRMHMSGDPEKDVVTLQNRKAFKGNKDGKDAAAIVVIKANPKLSAVKLSHLLKEHDIERSAEWVRKRRFELVQENGGMMQ